MNWIKVKDRLPENNKTVLAWTSRADTVFVWYNLITEQWLTDDDNLPLADGFIVAWRKIEEYADDE